MILDSSLPGVELIIKGLENLEHGEKTLEALLVAIGRPRLCRLGINVPQVNFPVCPELLLYRLLLKQNKNTAYSLYNSYLRRLISFEQALEHASVNQP